MMARVREVVFVSMMVALMVGCCPRSVEAIVADTPREAWRESVTLRYVSTDTLLVANVGVVARVESAKAEECMTLSIECQAPSGAHFESEVTLTPEEEQRGGSFREFRCAWVESAQFAESGDYLFRVTPTEMLDGVWNVGITIE